MTPALDAFKLSFEISPIILTGGIASGIPGAMLPVLSLANALNFSTGLLSGGELDLDNAFAHFQVLPGGTLIDYKPGQYPFANSNIAANTMIKQPLTLSMLMQCPANGSNSYTDKLATVMAIQAAFDQHIQAGGTFTVATPSYIYTDLVMTGMRDASHMDSKQVQNAWQIDFEKPLVTLEDAAQAQNSMMSKISNGVSTEGATSGVDQTVGSPATLATSSIAPAASNSAGTGAAGPAAGGPGTSR